jgi:hypothetical protein
VGRNLNHHLSYLNVRVLQVRVVSSELTMTLLVRLTFTNWVRHVHIKIQILSLPTTSTIFVIDNDVEFVACFVCCVVNIVKHICIAILMK